MSFRLLISRRIEIRSPLPESKKMQKQFLSAQVFDHIRTPDCFEKIFRFENKASIRECFFQVSTQSLCPVCAIRVFGHRGDSVSAFLVSIVQCN